MIRAAATPVSGRKPIPGLVSVLVLAGLVCATSCSYEAKVTTGHEFAPPPGTGQVEIEMRGAWVVTGIAPLEAEYTERAEALTRVRTGLLPPRIGDVLTIDDGGFATASSVPMRLEARPDRRFLEVDIYKNQFDGRVARFQIQATPIGTLAVEGLFAWSITAGSVDEDHMRAMLRYFLTTDDGIVQGVQELALLRAR